MEITTEYPFGDATCVLHLLIEDRPDRPERRAASGAGTPPLVFVLIHGLGMGAQYWRPLAERLVPHGTVLAFDLPGFGDAPEPPAPQSIPDTGQALDRCLEALLAPAAASPPTPRAPFRLGPGPHRVVLVGHSMGTQVAVEAAAARPDLIDRLVLIAPTINAAERTLPWQIWRMVQDTVTAGPRVWFIGAWSYLKVGPRWFWGKLRTMLDHRIEDTLPRVSTPTVVIRAEHDKVCPPDWVSRVTQTLPSARMTQVPGRGHETMVSRADDVAALIVEQAGTSSAP